MFEIDLPDAHLLGRTPSALTILSKLEGRKCSGNYESNFAGFLDADHERMSSAICRRCCEGGSRRAHALPRFLRPGPVSSASAGASTNWRRRGGARYRAMCAPYAFEDGKLSGGEAQRPREAGEDVVRKAKRPASVGVCAVLGRRCSAMTGTRGEKTRSVNSVLGCRCSTTRVHGGGQRKRHGLRCADEEPMYRGASGGVKRKAMRSGERAVLGRRCSTMTGTRGGRMMSVSSVLGCRCSTTRVHEGCQRERRSRRAEEGPIGARCRRGGVMSTVCVRGMLGVRPYGHAGIGGRRPRKYIDGVARRWTLGHAGDLGSILEGACPPRGLWSATARRRVWGAMPRGGWWRGWWWWGDTRAYLSLEGKEAYGRQEHR